MSHRINEQYSIASVGEASNATSDPVRYLGGEGISETSARLLRSRHVQPQATSQHNVPVSIAITTGGNEEETFEDSFPHLSAATADEEIRDQDRFLPIANVARVMKRHIPGNGKISKEAKECMQECVSEFISFITSEACDRCQTERRKTITGEDILCSMQALGFDNFMKPLQTFLLGYRETIRGLPTTRFDLPYEGVGDEAGAATASTSSSAAGSTTGGATVPTTVPTEAEQFMNTMGDFQYEASEANDDSFIDVGGQGDLLPSAHASRASTGRISETDDLHSLNVNHNGDTSFRRRTTSDDNDFTMVPSSELTAPPSSSFG